jgi:hypothetical protein
MKRAVEQGDEADEAFGGTNPRAASGARPEVPPNARAVSDGRGHRFAAYPRCSADHAGAKRVRTEVPMTDRMAKWIGRGAALTIVAAMGCAIAFVYFTPNRTVSWALEFGAAMVLVVFAAWAVADWAMHRHLHDSPALTADDARAWQSREDAKFGPLVPFEYLLGSSKQRQITKYLGSDHGQAHASDAGSAGGRTRG